MAEIGRIQAYGSPCGSKTDIISISLQQTTALYR